MNSFAKSTLETYSPSTNPNGTYHQPPDLIFHLPPSLQANGSTTIKSRTNVFSKSQPDSRSPIPNHPCRRLRPNLETTRRPHSPSLPHERSLILSSIIIHRLPQHFYTKTQKDKTIDRRRIKWTETCRPIPTERPLRKGLNYSGLWLRERIYKKVQEFPSISTSRNTTQIHSPSLFPSV